MTTRATWTRDGPYDLHVIGYRSQTVGVPYSSLTIVRGWTVPTLYGERLSLGAYMTRANRRDTLTVVHPFAADREQYYRFSGGDTVTTLRVGGRTVPIARIRVHPDFHHETRFGAFDGEIDIDATRFEIVRMRGQMVVLGGRESFGARQSEYRGARQRRAPARAHFSGLVRRDEPVGLPRQRRDRVLRSAALV